MKDILDQNRVLKLNKNWQPVSTCSVRMAIKSMTKDPKSGKEEDRQFRALHIDYPELENGEIDFSNAVTILPVKWSDWIALPVRPQDKFLRTVKGAIRVPTVIIAENYKKIPTKTPQYSSYEVARRDEYIDQYTGKFVPRDKGNIDHYIPRKHGGTTSWENCVWTSREINELKADLTPEQFKKKYGYALLRRPVKPKPRVYITNRFNIPDWDLFLKNGNS